MRQHQPIGRGLGLTRGWQGTPCVMGRGIGQDLIPISQKVQIDDARLPARPLALAPQTRLDPVQFAQQIHR